MQKNQYHNSARRVKKLTDAALVGNKQLLQGDEKVHSKAAPDHVDTASGIKIPNLFADVYNDLYNSVDDKEDIITLNQGLHMEQLM